MSRLRAAFSFSKTGIFARHTHHIKLHEMGVIFKPRATSSLEDNVPKRLHEQVIPGIDGARKTPVQAVIAETVRCFVSNPVFLGPVPVRMPICSNLCEVGNVQ